RRDPRGDRAGSRCDAGRRAGPVVRAPHRRERPRGGDHGPVGPGARRGQRPADRPDAGRLRAMTEGGLLVATDAVRRHDPAIKAFASDNYAGVHPEVLEAIALANGGHQVAYGDDVYSAALADLFRRHFGDRAEAFPVFNGTAANVVALRSMCAPWEAVICPETAHINTDEGGAPEVTGGLKLLTVPTEDGKLTPEAIDRYARGLGDVHRAQPRVVSISNA